MILAKSWWDSGGSEATFLIVGAALTILAAFVAESAKHKREKERRTHEWQRQTLSELQESASELIEAAGKTEIGSRPRPEVPPARVEVLCSRVLDDALRADCTTFIEEYKSFDMWLLLNQDDDPSDDEILDPFQRCGVAWELFNERLGELLRTTYA